MGSGGNVSGSARRTRIAALGIALLGAVFTAKNASLPIVRNSLVYARIVQGLRLHHLRAWQVCSDPAQVHSQGCGFPILALPFTRIAGLNAGLMIASWAATALFVAAMVVFFRRFNGSFDLGEADVPLELAVACFNPLIIAQFWSAYSDSAFGALFLVSFVLLDRLLKDDALNEAGAALAYTLCVMIAVVVRPAGLVLYPLHLLYAVWHRDRVIAIARSRRNRFLLLATSAVVLGIWVGLGKLGHNPLLNVNKGEYDIPVPYLSAGLEVVDLLSITFGVLLVVALPTLAVTRRSAAMLAVLVAYVHIFMVFHASPSNMRYYVPIIPLTALFIVRALRSIGRKRLAAAGFAAYLVTNGAMVLAFNDASVQRLFARVAPRRINFREFGHFDNLRIDAQLRMKDALDRVNRELPPGATLYYVSAYYDGIAQGVYQDAGLIRPDIRIRYASSVADLHVPDRAWVFFPEKLGTQPGERQATPSEWLTRVSPPVARIRG